jgi:glutaredoxin
MKGNPHCKRACKALEKAGIQHLYLEYGSYFAQWKKRLSLKIWLGWKTFPMVFIEGQFIGGASELQTYLKSDAGKNLK